MKKTRRIAARNTAMPTLDELRAIRTPKMKPKYISVRVPLSTTIGPIYIDMHIPESAATAFRAGGGK